jgi:hypothetical protein
MDVVATWPAAAYLPAPATVPQAPPSLPVTPHQVRKGAQPLSSRPFPFTLIPSSHSRQRPYP